jgi:hypothetical protein
MVDAALTFLALLAALVAFHFLRAFLPSYVSEKAKNLATKEDIEHITQKIESVKHGYALLLEEYRKKEQLRFAALDRRLEVHQQAFTLWWKLLSSLHSQDVHDAIQECQEFWVRNNLYLSEDASHAFQGSFRAAGDHEFLKDAARGGGHDGRKQVEDNFARKGDVPCRA